MTFSDLPTLAFLCGFAVAVLAVAVSITAVGLWLVDWKLRRNLREAGLRS